jgi:hypothetical protein
VRALNGLLLAVSALSAQPIPQNLITMSGCWSHQIGGYVQEKQTAAGFGISYGYRFYRFMEAEAGLFAALDPAGTECEKFGCADVGDRFYWIPFGIRFLAPLYLDRMEFSGGGGGLYEKYTPGTGGPPGYGVTLGRDGWGGYFVGSAAVSLDRSRRFWLAVTPRWFLANPSYARDRWLQIAGEIQVRFDKRGKLPLPKRQ